MAESSRAPRRRARQGGFTMIELLVTMLLLTIVLTGLAALQVQAIRQVSRSRQAAQATRLAQSVIERYKMAGGSSLSATGGNWVPQLQRNGTDTMTNVGPDGESDGPFTVEYLIEQVTNGYLVTVKVSWQDMSQGGNTANVALSTLIY